MSRCSPPSAVAACQHRVACSLLFFFFFVVVVVLPLLIPMTQGYAGGHQEAVLVGEDPHTQSPPVDGGEHAEEQQLNRLGSRPPCCDRRCGACAPCKAVQVRAGANYEPVWWKCKCGGAVFDP